MTDMTRKHRSFWFRENLSIRYLREGSAGVKVKITYTIYTFLNSAKAKDSVYINMSAWKCLLQKTQNFPPSFSSSRFIFQTVGTVGNCPHSTKKSYQKKNLKSGENYGSYQRILQCAPRLLAQLHTITDNIWEIYQRYLGLRNFYR